MEEKLPIFVYGTLMSGFGNYMRLLHGHYTTTQKGCIHGFEMVSLGGFPMILNSELTDKVVCGELFWINQEEYDQVLHNLDRLEGHPSFYIRTKVPVIVGQDVCNAYVYVGSKDYTERKDTFNKVADGDWRKYVETGQRNHTWC